MSNPLPATNYFPSTFDRATGGDLGGTPYPILTPTSDSPLIQAIGLNYAGGNTPGPFPNPGGNGISANYVQIFEEDSDSPKIESGEQSTIVHSFTVDYYTGQQLILNYPRGTVLQDSDYFGSDGVIGNLSRVLTTTLQPIAKTNTMVCRFTMTCESMTFGNPPDEFSVEVVELNPAAEKHPRYRTLSYSNRRVVRQAIVVDQEDLSQQYQNIIDAIPVITSGPNQNVDPYTMLNAQSQSLELLNKKWKGEDSFYLSGYKVTWSTYFWLPQFINPGGYIEEPWSNSGGLPYQFISTTGDATGENVFAYTTFMNANMFPSPQLEDPFGLSWLRQTDTLNLVRTWYKLQRTWIGGPLGHWDNEWYNPVQQPSAFNQNAGSLIF